MGEALVLVVTLVEALVEEEEEEEEELLSSLTVAAAATVLVVLSPLLALLVPLGATLLAVLALRVAGASRIGNNSPSSSAVIRLE